jgi:hypothetical protein
MRVETINSGVHIALKGAYLCMGLKPGRQGRSKRVGELNLTVRIRPKKLYNAYGPGLVC